jgi:uncharacterized membrane protein
MIQCHVFNSFTRLDLRGGGPYILSQFVGGMAAVLFLFMAGMTLGFQMESLDRREPSGLRRWGGALRRGAYVLGIAFAFRLTNYVAGWPKAQVDEILKVDILNCMGVAMLAMAAAALVRPAMRVQAAVIAGLAVACAAPLIDGMDWRGVPDLVRAYVVPNSGRFPFFPWTAYLAFGIAAGVVVKRTRPERLERVMQWSAALGFVLVFGAQYFSNLPFSLYEKSEFWIDSPGLVLIRTGVSLLALAVAYVWTEYGASERWSWMQALGKTSLLVYWIHVMMVYGDIVKPFKKNFPIWGSALATVVVTALMVGLAAGRLWWKARRTEKLHAVTQTAEPDALDGVAS